MIKQNFYKTFAGVSRIFLGIGDFFVCALSFCFSKFLFDVFGPWIKKPPIVSEAIQYFKESGCFFLVLYVLLLYSVESLKAALNQPKRMGWLGLAVVSGLYTGGLAFWFEAKGFSLKTFFTLSFFVLWTLMIVWRCFTLRGVTAFFQMFPRKFFFIGVVVKNISRVLVFFKKKPSAFFIISFMILLIGCSGLLFFNKVKASEELADWAYFSLVGGVFSLLIEVILKKDETDQD